MPTYEFVCTKKTCKHEFSELCSFSDYENGFTSIACPECGKKKPKKLLSANVLFADSPDKMNNFEWFGQKNMEAAQVQSHNAREEAKKRGIAPYRELPDGTDNGRRMNFVD